MMVVQVKGVREVWEPNSDLYMFLLKLNFPRCHVTEVKEGLKPDTA
jgi:hypothetical protein